MIRHYVMAWCYPLASTYMIAQHYVSLGVVLPSATTQHLGSRLRCLRCCHHHTLLINWWICSNSPLAEKPCIPISDTIRRKNIGQVGLKLKYLKWILLKISTRCDDGSNQSSVVYGQDVVLWHLVGQLLKRHSAELSYIYKLGGDIMQCHDF